MSFPTCCGYRYRGGVRVQVSHPNFMRVLRGKKQGIASLQQASVAVDEEPKRLGRQSHYCYVNCRRVEHSGFSKNCTQDPDGEFRAGCKLGFAGPN